MNCFRRLGEDELPNLTSTYVPSSLLGWCGRVGSDIDNHFLTKWGANEQEGECGSHQPDISHKRNILDNPLANQSIYGVLSIGPVQKNSSRHFQSGWKSLLVFTRSQTYTPEEPSIEDDWKWMIWVDVFLFQGIFQVLTVDGSEILHHLGCRNPINNRINYLPTDAGCLFRPRCMSVSGFVFFEAHDLHPHFISSEQWIKGPLVVCWVYRGWNSTQLWGNYFNKPWNQDPVFNQPGFNEK